LEILGRLPARYPVLAACLAGLGVALTPGMPSVVGRVSLLGPIAQDIAESLRHQPRSNGTAGLALATLLGAGMMGTLFLTGSPMVLVLYGLLPADARAGVSFISWFVAALPLHLVMFAGTLAFIVHRCRPDREPPTGKTLRVQRAVLGRVNGGEWLALGVFTLLLVGFSTQPLHGVEPAWLALFGVAVMFWGRLVDADALRRGVNWQLLLYLGVILSLGEVLRVVEFDAWLAGVIVPALSGSGVQSGLLIVGIGLLAILASLAIGAIPAILVLALALLPVSAQLGISPWLAGLTLIVGANQWLYPQQNVVYISLYEASEQRAFSHAQARPVAIVFAAVTIIGLIVSVPYWQALGLLY
jgi:divalent anion:Na+ symporter, DASS family